MTLISNGEASPRLRSQRSFVRLILFPFATLRGRLVVGAVVP